MIEGFEAEDWDVVGDFFLYLDELRESGDTNMFAAALYLEREFGVSEPDAGIILQAWMKTFSREKGVTERAIEALETDANPV